VVEGERSRELVGLERGCGMAAKRLAQLRPLDGKGKPSVPSIVAREIESLPTRWRSFSLAIGPG